jgi:hypothetical protein
MVNLVSGTLHVGEAMPAAKAIATRQGGGQAILSFLLVAMLIVSAGLGAIAWRSNALGGAGLGVFAGFILYVAICKRLVVFSFRRRFIDRGLPLVLPLSIEITDEALDYSLGDVREIAKWSAITELFFSHGYWIFLAQGSPYFVPERLFQSKSEEKEFVRTALRHMSDSAQSLSPAAVTFTSVT